MSLICEQCSEEIIYLEADYDAMDERRRTHYRCDNCKPYRSARKRKRDRPRDDGCIVTAIRPDGKTVVLHRPGPTPVALREIIENLPLGSTVQSISTPRTILRDMQSKPRTFGGRGRINSNSQFSVERTLLAQIGRADMLPGGA